MLDIGFLEQILIDLALAGRVKNLFLDLGVDRQIQADLLGQRPLAAISARLLEILEQLLDGAMVCFEERNCVLRLGLGHSAHSLLALASKPTGALGCS